ncbi:MAG: HAD-IIIC family phosphatase [Ruminiclostridium sp.]|nr:HAD-IIIC family phosphatase [Ruminiclostridium sp.]
MKELQYPFDAGYILKKKKSIKKQLLADNMPRVEKKIAILGGSTTNDIRDITELFLLDYGIKPQFYMSEYNRYWQDAVFDNPELQEFAPDIVFIHTTNRNIIKYPDVTSTREEADAILKDQLSHFETMWKAIADKYHCPVIQNNFEQPYFRLMGNRDCFDYRGRVNFINRLNMAFADYAESHEGFYINDINYLSACYGIDKWSEPAAWHMYKYAMCIPAIPDFAFNLAGIIKSVFGKNRKSLVLDLDNTLWGGVVGDDGVDGIEIGQETHMGQVYSEFQKYLALVKNTGVMLTVCSKNEEENAIAGLKHPEGILKPEDFIIIKANWDNKDRNIEAIANELNIGLDALVFLDDNPAERAIVSSQLPMVAVPEMTAPEDYIRTVDRSHFFEITSFSGDDLKRNEMYKKNAERAAMQSQFADYGEYLTSLDMVGVIDDFLPVYLPRITQLTNKSNQFNLTTRRFTTSEMEEVFADEGYIRLYGKLTDKFGDNGIVSVVIGKINGDTLDVILWLMSCRVLKRDMEYAMLDNLVERAAQKGIREIKGYYYPTAKNKMVKELYADFGFTKISEDEEGNTVWSLETAGYKTKNNYIKVERNKEND